MFLNDPWNAAAPTGLILLEDGTEIYGTGVGATGAVAAEICFNTALTGYQEILTDPSYAGQIVTFTFPHIGNVGANDEDIETISLDPETTVSGGIFRAEITEPSNYRATLSFPEWLKKRGIIGVSGVDTRALTMRIREKGFINGVIAHSPDGTFDRDDLKEKLSRFHGLDDVDLAIEVSGTEVESWTQTPWTFENGFGESESAEFHVVAVDFGAKRNILRLLTGKGCKITIVPAKTAAKDILALNPDGVFLSNGPGDPAATGKYAVPMVQKLLSEGVPMFGICLGHQILGLALGGKTVKMHQGHHGANHPVKDLETGKVEVTSMNHGFAVDPDSLPEHVIQTHVSLFDGTNCGLRVANKPVFSVQQHPEASPGPTDSYYLFDRFTHLMREHKKASV